MSMPSNPEGNRDFSPRVHAATAIAVLGGLATAVGNLYGSPKLVIGGMAAILGGTMLLPTSEQDQE